MSKRKRISYTDSEGKTHEIPLFDTEITLGGSNNEELSDLKSELQLDDDVKELARKITEIKQGKSPSITYYEIGAEINRLFNKYRRKKTRGFRSKQKILQRLIDETKEIKDIKGITIRQLRNMSNFARNLIKSEVKTYISWSVYSEIFTHNLNKKTQNKLIELVHEKKITKRNDVRNWIQEQKE